MYETNLSDAQWQDIKKLIPLEQRKRKGVLRTAQGGVEESFIR